MGFWSSLAKVALPAAAFAIPGVGPVVGSALAGAGKFLGTPGGATLAGLAGDLVGAGLQARGMNRAADITARSNQQAIDLLKEQDARDFAEYLKERDRSWRYEDEDRALQYRREGEREARLTPFRAGAERGYQTLSSLLYDPSQQIAMHPPVGSVKRRSFADLL